jgi:hypothetical protein
MMENGKWLGGSMERNVEFLDAENHKTDEGAAVLPISSA